jgi:Amt family ammonium transporter
MRKLPVPAVPAPFAFGSAVVASALLVSASAFAEEAAEVAPTVASATEAAAQAAFVGHNVWMMVCTGLVFLMHLGFATLESGLSRSKNTVNILFKNVFIVCIGLLTYYLVGFNLMYPGDFNGYFGFGGFPLDPGEAGQTIAYHNGTYTYWTDFLFQGMFAATCCTIISGAVAERIKLKSFLVFATLFVAFVYPVAGSWKWGGGFLDDMGFYDFAGSTLVHSVGGWGALVGAWMLGPRIGKYTRNGVSPIPGSNMVSAAIGVMLLWLGWFGFNGGSVLSADPAATSFTLVTTCMAAAAGGIGAVVAYNFVSKKPDLSMLLNGILAGLVGITAGADTIPVGLSILVGFVAGVIVVFAVVFFDKIKIDDPVGATSVHLACGVWGTLAVGLFSSNPKHTFVTQLIGVGVYAVFSLIASYVLFSLVRATMGLRVSVEEETDGLDSGEHDMHAYDMTSTAPMIARPAVMPHGEPDAAQ